MYRFPLLSGFLFLTVASSTAQEPRVTIRSDFPGGNVKVLANEPKAVTIAPDLRGSPDWFYWYFSAQTDHPGDVTFTLPHAPKLGVRGPAISRDDGKTWGWLPTDAVIFASPGAKPADRIDRFTVHFHRAGETVRLAVTIPYGQADLDAFLATHASNPLLHSEVLTHTRTGRKPVELLRIGEPGAGKQAVLVTARHHACETIASFVLEGFLTEALSASPAAQEFRKRHVLYAVPFVDKDGVLAGDQGKNRPPHDHNRDYGPGSLYPEVQAIMELAERADIRLALDLHCPFIRGDVHEAFHFLGLGLPHIRDNLHDWIFWISEECPRVTTAPIDLLVDDAKPNARNPRMNSHYFALRNGSRFAATLEVPYAQRRANRGPTLARAYGAALLRSWILAEFLASGEKRQNGTVSQLQNLRSEFQRTYRRQPRVAEQLLTERMNDPTTPTVLRNESRVLLTQLRLYEKQYSSAHDLSVSLVSSPSTTAFQRETAAWLGIQAICQNPATTVKQVDSAVETAFGRPFLSDRFRANVLEAAANYHLDHSSPAVTLTYLRKLRPVVPATDEGRVLNRIAAVLDLGKRPEEAIAARKEAVRILRSRLDPVPQSVFGARMCGDLLDAVQGIPTSTPAERREAAEWILAHKVSNRERKQQAQQVLASLGAAP